MNLSKHLALSAATAVLLSSCYYDEYGANSYGDPYQQQGGAYGDSQQSDYYGGGNAGQTPQGGYGGNQPSGYESESGDVVTYPGDSGGGAPNYSGSTGGYGNPTPQPSAGSGRRYTVQKGDTLYGIRRKFGGSLEGLMQANGLSTSTIHPGQELIIP